MVRKTLASLGLLSGANRCEVPPESANREALTAFHAPEYLDALKSGQDGHLDVAMMQMGIGMPDNPVFKGMYDYAALDCGASLMGAQLLLDGKAGIAFNPSGGYHHAHAARAAGFCYINDVALACLHLARAGKRVVYLDIDAHHGDGVQEAFWNRNDVLTISLHESGRSLFPGTGFEDEIGVGQGKGYSVNIPMPMQVYDEAYLKAFRAVATPLIDAFDPDMIVLELGMDGLAGDPLTHMGLTNNAHAEVIEYVIALGKPFLATGGGGYHLENTARAWAMAWRLFCGDDAHDDSHALGGVMLESTEWHGGLRDRQLIPDARQREHVDPAVDATIEKAKTNVFRFHGI